MQTMLSITQSIMQQGTGVTSYESSGLLRVERLVVQLVANSMESPVTIAKGSIAGWTSRLDGISRASLRGRSIPPSHHLLLRGDGLDG
jgi:hypothetical protein